MSQHARRDRTTADTGNARHARNEHGRTAEQQAYLDRIYLGVPPTDDDFRIAYERFGPEISDARKRGATEIKIAPGIAPARLRPVAAKRQKAVPGISAAEKYAEVGDARPRCECHGQLMRWQKLPRLRAGGNWHCVVKARSARLAHYDRQRAAYLREKAAAA